MSARFDDKNSAERKKRQRGRLRVPAALAVAVVGGSLTVTAAGAGCDARDEEPPVFDAGEVNTQGNMRLDASTIVDASDTPQDAAVADAAVDAPVDAPHT